LGMLVALSIVARGRARVFGMGVLVAPGAISVRLRAGLRDESAGLFG